MAVTITTYPSPTLGGTTTTLYNRILDLGMTEIDSFTSLAIGYPNQGQGTLNIYPSADYGGNYPTSINSYTHTGKAYLLSNGSGSFSQYYSLVLQSDDSADRITGKSFRHINVYGWDNINKYFIARSPPLVNLAASGIQYQTTNITSYNATIIKDTEDYFSFLILSDPNTQAPMWAYGYIKVKTPQSWFNENYSCSIFAVGLWSFRNGNAYIYVGCPYDYFTSAQPYSIGSNYGRGLSYGFTPFSSVLLSSRYDTVDTAAISYLPVKDSSGNLIFDKVGIDLRVNNVFVGVSSPRLILGPTMAYLYRAITADGSTLLSLGYGLWVNIS